MLSNETNSRGSNWSPESKVIHYLDTSKKINPVSVSSIKLRIMLQICKENKWGEKEILDHQEKMYGILQERMVEKFPFGE